MAHECRHKQRRNKLADEHDVKNVRERVQRLVEIGKVSRAQNGRYCDNPAEPGYPADKRPDRDSARIRSKIGESVFLSRRYQLPGVSQRQIDASLHPPSLRSKNDSSHSDRNANYCPDERSI